MFRKVILSFALSRAALYSGTAADLASTEIAMKRGAVELNPLLGQNRVQRIAVSGGMAILTDWATQRMKVAHPKLAAGINWVGAGVHFSATASNLRR
jgi:hypothetical protein